MTAFLKLDASDNVQVALRRAPAGSLLDGPDGPVTTLTEVAMAHKVADRPIAAGAAVVKYGMPIGEATEDIPAGAHVHVHNIRSRYTPTHYRKDDAGLSNG